MMRLKLYPIFMEKLRQNPDNRDGKNVDPIVAEYINALSDEHRMLVLLKGQLYGGSFEPMLNDLQNRLDGKPYIFKLVNRINDDIERIKELMAFEDEHGVDLAEYVALPNE